MTHLSSYFAFFTNGDRPYETFAQSAGSTVFMGPLRPLVMPQPSDSFFGPYAAGFARAKATHGFLLAATREARAGVGSYFTDVRRAVLQATVGLTGWGLDVLRLTPFPLEQASEALPDDFLADDVFSLGLVDQGAHGIRAETFGFAKLGQPELIFSFAGEELMEEAQLFCGHVCEWLVDHGQRLLGGSQVSFGLDTLHLNATGDARSARAWHAPYMCQLLPEALFAGVGAVEVTREGHHDLTLLLRAAQAQRRVLEEYEVSGASPQGGSTASVVGNVGSLVCMSALREEASGPKDSGWRFEWPGGGQKTLSLREIVGFSPALAPFLALPPGVGVRWNAVGSVCVDTSRVTPPENEP